MAGTTITVRELLYEVTANFTKVTEFGVSLEALVSGQATPPLEGARVDVDFEGVLRGPRLNGTISGVDYLLIRADGRVQLHIHGAITTDDAQSIAFFADGIASPREGTGLLSLSENVTLSTSSPAYSWVNHLQVWAQGTVDPANGEINVKGYAA